MQLPKVKTLEVHGEFLTVFSFDGRLWLSEPRDYRAFTNRFLKEKRELQNEVNRVIPDLAAIGDDPESEFRLWL